MNIRTVSITLLLATATGFAVAQEQGPIVFSNIAQKEVVVIDENGEESIELASVEIVLPGDTVLYTSTFTNQGEEAVSNIVVDNPVPENTQYLGFSARGESTEVVFSVDGGATFAGAAELTITGDNGEQRTALPEEYTNIRWIYAPELAPGQSSSVSFKVRIP
jgi:uncharacterized repeat protein (TIGR01451 family)